MHTPLITLDALTLGYNRQILVHSLNGIIHNGDMLAITGPNGGGKSTLMKALVGVIKPQSGHVIWTSPRPRIAYLPQQSEIDSQFPVTVYQLIEMGILACKGLWSKISPEDHKHIRSAITRVGLEGIEHQLLGTLSGGQFQRALFARLMVQNADVVMLDEPFTALDYDTMHDLIHVLMEWQKQGKTIITVLHDMDIIRSHFPRTLLLAREVIGWGETSDALCTQGLTEARKKAKNWEHVVMNSSAVLS